MMSCSSSDKDTSGDGVPSYEASQTIGGDEDEKKNEEEDEEEESEEAYRLRIYGTTSSSDHPFLLEETSSNSERSTSSLRRLSRQISRRASSITVQDVTPKTISGWTILASSIAATVLGYEVNLQKTLTAPPIVYGQCSESTESTTSTNTADDAPIAKVHRIMLNNSDNDRTSILKRPIQPSLFVGTRSAASSMAAYTLSGPGYSDRHVKFREVMTMPADGAVIAVDWELPILRPRSHDDTSINDEKTIQERKDEVLHGPIQQPIVLILHGINNDASFGYVQSMVRAVTDQGWVAAAMNFRGCGGVPLTTPRTYNGAYTGDIRGVVQTLSKRLSVRRKKHQLILVGNSLGANLVAKYLGEEGKSGTLPDCVAGGVTMGNPMAIDSRNMSKLYSPVICTGAKLGLLRVWNSMKHMHSPHFRHCIRKALSAYSLAQYDQALAPIFCRNEPNAPFQYKVGYDNGATDYWQDASSYRQTPHVSVPLLQLVASDDFLVFGPHRGKFTYNISNPNIMVMTTTCGGHLGWHEAPPNGWGIGRSWADTAMVDFIQAVLEYHAQHDRESSVPPKQQQVAPELRSRL